MPESKETIALQKAIERFITQNMDLVQQVQIYAQKILDAGLIDPSTTMPFRIIPTDILVEGTLLCKLYLYLDSPLYGFFEIEFLENAARITCPSIYKQKNIILKHEELDSWIDTIASEMDNFYKLQSAASENQLIFCEMFLNTLIESYQTWAHEPIKKIKEYIEQNKKIAILAGNEYALIKDAKKDYDSALLMPSAWVVFKSLKDLPDQDEPVEDYVDEAETNKLFEKLSDFFQLQSYYSAPVMLSQKILLQSGVNVEARTKTDDEWKKAWLGEDGIEFIFSPIDIKEFRLS